MFSISTLNLLAEKNDSTISLCKLNPPSLNSKQRFQQLLSSLKLRFTERESDLFSNPNYPTVIFIKLNFNIKSSPNFTLDFFHIKNEKLLSCFSTDLHCLTIKEYNKKLLYFKKSKSILLDSTEIPDEILELLDLQIDFHKISESMKVEFTSIECRKLHVTRCFYKRILSKKQRELILEDSTLLTDL